VSGGASGQLELRQVAEPPDPPPGHAVLRVLASAINRGERSRLMTAPEGHVFGWDVAGVVERVGGPDAPLVPGDRVAALSLLGGGWAQRVTVRLADVCAIPDGVGTAEAALVPVAGLTAFRAVRAAGALLGKTVLVIGGGAVGAYAVQLGVLGGARVIAAVRTQEAADRMRELGVHRVLVGTPPPQAACDLVVDTVGGAMSQVALASCRPSGRLVIVGNVGAGGDGLSPVALVAAGCLVQGYRLVVDAAGAPVGADLDTLVTWMAEGRVRMPPVREVDWHDAVAVAEAVAGQPGHARTVLRMADDGFPAPRSVPG
jgi:NADPH:quinone reductase-like Zn-dependent oxidoreductase